MYKYLVGVGVSGINSSTPGNTYLDFFFPFTEETLQQVKINEIMKNSWDPSMGPLPNFYQDQNTPDMIYIPFMAKMRQTSNDLIICLFSSEFEWSRENMGAYISYTSIERIKEAQIRL